MRYYAEHLSNLNHVALCIESNVTDYAEISSHCADQLILGFPGSISQAIHLPANTELLTKRQITGLDKGARLKLMSLGNKRNDPQFGKFVPPQCRCGVDLTYKPVKWKQLPSEHWAELMDLWHCHKPSEPSNGSAGMYDLALNGFHPKPGLAFYSDTYYLLHADDISVSEHHDSCPLSNSLSKEISERPTLKLWKWDLDPQGAVAPTVARMLAELIDAHAVFTFTINESLIIWVLNASTNYALTNCESALSGAKILYGETAKLREKRPDPEPISIPTVAFDKLIMEMTEINELLPQSARQMGEWKMCLL